MLKKRQAIMMVSIAVVSFVIGTTFNVTVASNGGNPFDNIWEILRVHQGKLEILEARVEALETPIRIRVEAHPTSDIYLRSHGLSIDEPLPENWWLYGYEFMVTDTHFTYERAISGLGLGSHYVEYAASGYVPDYAWHAKIYINDILSAEGDVGRYTHLRAYFDVGS